MFHSQLRFPAIEKWNLLRGTFFTMLSSEDLERLITAKKREIQEEKAQLGLAPPNNSNVSNVFPNTQRISLSYLFFSQSVCTCCTGGCVVCYGIDFLVDTSVASSSISVTSTHCTRIRKHFGSHYCTILWLFIDFLSKGWCVEVWLWMESKFQWSFFRLTALQCLLHLFSDICCITNCVIQSRIGLSNEIMIMFSEL